MPQTDTTTGPDAPAVSGGWIARFGLLYFGQNISWAAPGQLLLAQQILTWYPDTKETRLGWLMAIGSVAAIAASPLAGYLSDRTASRFGRRAPWVLGGAISAAAALIMAGAAPSFWWLVGAWTLFQIGIAFSTTTALTIPPDRVPGHQYGMVSGIMGLTYTVAVVAGTGVATVFTGQLAYGVTAALLIVCVLPFLLIDREPPSAAAPADATGPRRAGLNLPSLREHPDYWWVFATRLLVTLAQAIALFYLLYFLRDRVGYADPDGGVLTLSVVYALCLVVTAVWSGRASDATGKRRVFVSVSSYGVAAACLGMAVVTSFTLVVAAAALLGVSWGVYQAIDQALVNHVLPDDADRSAHMGFMHLSVIVPNTIAPVIAAITVTELGGYPSLYILAAVLSTVGGALITKIRSVR